MKLEGLAGMSVNERNEADFYITPAHAVYSLLEKEQFVGNIWEPACGDGAISKVLIDKKFDVISSDIYDWGYGETGVNFLKERRVCNNIITNPPYLLAKQFAEHALECVSQKVALLLKLNFLEGIKRKSFLENSPLRKVYVFSKRVRFDRGDGKSVKKSVQQGLLAFAWFIWEKNYKGEPTIGWI
jgi:hypothetical protein